MEVRVDLGLLRGSGCLGGSLAGADRSTTTTPTGVTILLGGVIGNLTMCSYGSSPLGESPDPVVGSGGVASSSKSFSSLGHRLEDFCGNDDGGEQVLWCFLRLDVHGGLCGNNDGGEQYRRRGLGPGSRLFFSDVSWECLDYVLL
ncbi:hypothetical protein D1007_44910 [Hordeum vulgare]|nr:hypothetical protein D1007_44910 [Hordeum vulgare]